MVYSGPCLTHAQMWDSQYKKDFGVRCNVEWRLRRPNGIQRAMFDACTNAGFAIQKRFRSQMQCGMALHKKLQGRFRAKVSKGLDVD